MTREEANTLAIGIWRDCHRMAQSLIPSPQAEDVAQQAILTVLTRYHQCTAEGAENQKKWAMRVVYNQARDYLRLLARTENCPGTDALGALEWAAGVPDPHDVTPLEWVVAQERAEEAQKFLPVALAMLSPDRQRAIRAVYDEGSMVELAASLGRTAEATRQLKTRAAAELRRAYRRIEAAHYNLPAPRRDAA